MNKVETILPRGEILEMKNLKDGRILVVQSSEETDDSQTIGKIFYCFTDIVDYLISLFYKTNKKYSCSRTKIGKLLSILEFKYARMKKHRVFLRDIYRYPNCGTAIHALTVECDRDVYRMINYGDNNKKIAFSEIDFNVIPPMESKDFSCIPLEIREEIERVFCNFGAYTHKRLGDCLNPLVEYDSVCGPEGIVNLNRIAELTTYDIKNIGSNEVIDYIFSLE